MVLPVTSESPQLLARIKTLKETPTGLLELKKLKEECHQVDAHNKVYRKCPQSFSKNDFKTCESTRSLLIQLLTEQLYYVTQRSPESAPPPAVGKSPQKEKRLYAPPSLNEPKRRKPVLFNSEEMAVAAFLSGDFIPTRKWVDPQGNHYEMKANTQEGVIENPHWKTHFEGTFNNDLHLPWSGRGSFVIGGNLLTGTWENGAFTGTIHKGNLTLKGTYDFKTKTFNPSPECADLVKGLENLWEIEVKKLQISFIKDKHAKIPTWSDQQRRQELTNAYSHCLLMKQKLGLPIPPHEEFTQWRKTLPSTITQQDLINLLVVQERLIKEVQEIFF